MLLKLEHFNSKQNYLNKSATGKANVNWKGLSEVEHLQTQRKDKSKQEEVCLESHYPTCSVEYSINDVSQLSLLLNVLTIEGDYLLEVA